MAAIQGIFNHQRFNPIRAAAVVGVLFATLISACSLGKTPALEPGSTQVSEYDDMVLLFIPESTFAMGSENGDEDEKPVHNVTLDAFWIYQTEVTNGMYARCVAAMACVEPYDELMNPSYYADPDFADYPVVYVTWNMARQYCDWAGGRLPTEAQWELAARGSNDQRIYPWGNQAPNCSLANFHASSGLCIGDPWRVGGYPRGASPYGVLDMAGNVMEWVNDYYASTYYSVSPSKNPAGPDEGLDKVLRGGAYHTGENNLRVSDRTYTSPIITDTSGAYGFRCVIRP